MFFSIKSSEKGFEEEKRFFSLLEQAFKLEEAFAFQQIPFNSPDEAFRYEADTLFLHKQLGLFIFEVKSINIKNIKRIRGTEWLCNSSTGEYTMNPQKQAESQMFYTRNILNERCMLHNLFNSHAFVVLPNVSQKEWDEREDLQKEYIKRPILKDDLLNSNILYKKIYSLASKVQLKTLDSLRWRDLLDYFAIPYQDLRNLNNKALFSELHLIKSIPMNYEEELKKKLSQGLKIYILCEEEFPQKIKETLKRFSVNFQLFIYQNTTKQLFSKNEFIFDGNISKEKLREIGSAFLDFNLGQYEIIHTSKDENLSVSAGAGTGKTHVMVDRILFLLMKERITLEEINMITFTNASTNEMKERLEEHFLTLYQLTNKPLYLNYAEDISGMEISTIHSFAKSIIQTLAHELGFGSEIGLRSFKYEKQQIIFDILNDYFSLISTDVFLETEIRYYEFVSILMDMWDEMEKKGLSQDEISHLNFGTPNKNSVLIQSLIIRVFSECERRLEKIKKEKQSISMGDLIRKLKEFTAEDEVLKQLVPGKYLFVDEFQDSDDVQIEFIAKLQEILDYKVFVVGDIKQAIYRFRGADYRAFEELAKRLRKPFQSFDLRHNYRTSSPLLERFHRLFIHWGNTMNKDLSYTENSRLTSNLQSKTSYWHVERYNFNNRDTKNGELLEKHVNELREDEKLAILVRTNNHAQEMEKLCKSLGIATVQNLDGQFYLCDAVKHFYSLLLALQYPDQPMYVIEALKTPYFGYVINDKNFIATQGNKSRLQQFLKVSVGQNFSKYALLVRDYSPLTIIQFIIKEQNFHFRIEEYYDRQNLIKKKKDVEIQRYKVNIQHLLTIIEQQFSSNAVTIPMISKWLELQMKTNRTENEPVIKKVSAKVIISTVHRAKGLQYHSVFLPITNKPYDSIEPKYFVEDGTRIKEGESRRFGWCIESFRNNHYGDLNDIENDEARKEEVRLLYVALTRAKQKVIITLPTYNVKNSWSALLKEAGI